MKEIIKLKNLRKVYTMGKEKIIAIDNVDLNIKEREFVFLLGTSGSGKSTLLNLMAGLEKPTKGKIIIKNYSLEKMNERLLVEFRQRYIGFVFQSYNLIPTLTALENVSLPLIFKGVPKKIRENEAKKMLKAVGLEDRQNHKPYEMSGGQQQRVSIARAFVGNPSIIFADEPTGNLDTKTTIEVLDLITSIAEEFKQTLILVTHDMEITEYAHRIVEIRDGKIENKKNNIIAKGEEQI